MEEFIKTVGERIRQYRVQADLTQEQLAEKADLHTTYIGQVERGEKNISVKCLKQILNALGIPLSDFFTGIGSGNSSSGSKQDFPGMCYSMISSQPKEKQEIIYEILKSINKLHGK